MILYLLNCAEGHAFDSWFRDSAAYDRQAEQGAVRCPVCGSSNISKAIMAPHVARRAEAAPRTPLLDERHSALRAMIRELRETIAAATVDVGDAFPEEARRMEEGETEKRAIRGRASFEEAKALLEEGIEILPIPVLPSEGH
jgi:hypothetical protein